MLTSDPPRLLTARQPSTISKPKSFENKERIALCSIWPPSPSILVMSPADRDYNNRRSGTVGP